MMRLSSACFHALVPQQRSARKTPVTQDFIRAWERYLRASLEQRPQSKDCLDSCPVACLNEVSLDWQRETPMCVRIWDGVSPVGGLDHLDEKSATRGSDNPQTRKREVGPMGSWDTHIKT